MNYHTQQVKLNVDDATRDIIKTACEASNNLYNSVLYYVRQEFFGDDQNWVVVAGVDDAPTTRPKNKKMRASYSELCSIFKDNPHYKVLGGQPAQQTIKSVCEAVQADNALLTAFFKGESQQFPRRPKYRKKRGLAPISFPAQGVKFDLETGDCTLSMSKENKFYAQEIQVKTLTINGGFGFTPDGVVEVRIIPKLGEFYVEYVLKIESLNEGATGNLDLDRTYALGLDPGRDNWLTCVSTRGASFIIDGLKLKSLNLQYNKKVANLKKDKPGAYWDAELDRITEKRNNQMRDAINKTARFMVNHCLKNQIGVVVFGWNSGQKDNSKMSKKNNQQFVQIPTGRLKERIKQLCEENGVQFVETEEAYTSKSSFLDGDSLPRHGEKPSQYEASGRRVQRGLYRTKNGDLINADCNGAANIIRKVSTQLRLNDNLAKVSREVLNLPHRYCIFSDLSKEYRHLVSV